MHLRRHLSPKKGVFSEMHLRKSKKGGIFGNTSPKIQKRGCFWKCISENPKKGVFLKMHLRKHLFSCFRKCISEIRQILKKKTFWKCIFEVRSILDFLPEVTK